LTIFAAIKKQKALRHVGKSAMDFISDFGLGAGITTALLILFGFIIFGNPVGLACLALIIGSGIFYAGVSFFYQRVSGNRARRNMRTLENEIEQEELTLQLAKKNLKVLKKGHQFEVNKSAYHLPEGSIAIEAHLTMLTKLRMGIGMMGQAVLAIGIGMIISLGLVWIATVIFPVLPLLGPTLILGSALSVFYIYRALKRGTKQIINEINMHPVSEIRSKYKDQFEKIHKSRLGFMSFFVKATVEALKRFPAVNASIDGQDIVYHGYFDIGIAVSSPRGLVVPVLRNADQMSMAEIETAISDYANKAKEGKLTLEEMTGGTFTITNGGVFGSLLSTPIINPPQSGILGMHNIVQRPIVEDGQIVIRPMMYVALSYDHRIIDGRESVSFLVTIKQLLEDPARLLLEL